MLYLVLNAAYELSFARDIVTKLTVSASEICFSKLTARHQLLDLVIDFD